MDKAFGSALPEAQRGDFKVRARAPMRLCPPLCARGIVLTLWARRAGGVPTVLQNALAKVLLPLIGEDGV